MGHQSYQSHVIIRKNEAWWKDFIFLVGEVDKNNSRAWIWPDYMLWNEADQFFKKMPKSVVQSNWYYGENFDLGQMNENEQKYVKSYIDLEIHGYDQIPTGSYHADNEKSISNTVQFCKKHINDSRLLGFLQSFWKPTIEEHRERILKGIELMGDAKQWFEKNS